MWWLIYEPCAECTTPTCFQCAKPDRQLMVRAVQADERPPRALNGPCKTPQDLLDHLVRFFAFDEAGLMYFRAEAL